MKFRIKKVSPGRMLGKKFIPMRRNVQPALGMLNDVIALATPAGISKRGTLKKNPRNPNGEIVTGEIVEIDDRKAAALGLGEGTVQVLVLG
jgi:hypothetical protein